MATTGVQRVHERCAWIVLLVSAVSGLLAGLTPVLSPLSIMVESTFAAWWPLWLLPVLWLFHFLFNTATVHNLVIAVIAAVGPILTHHAFFSASGGQTFRVG
jgi:hypothetical protein